MKYEIGTQSYRVSDDCLVCAKRKADKLMSIGTKCYVMDNHSTDSDSYKGTKIVYGNYFK